MADLDDIEIRIVETGGDTLDYNSLTANITVDKPAGGAVLPLLQEDTLGYRLLKGATL